LRHETLPLYHRRGQRPARLPLGNPRHPRHLGPRPLEGRREVHAL